MSGPEDFVGWAFTEMRVTGSTLTPDDEQDNAILIGGEGSAAEIEQGTPAFGTLGILFRPRRPEPDTGELDDPDSNSLRTVAIAIRHGERLVPIAYRDPRLHRQYDPDEGTFAFVGYGGGRLVLEDAANDKTRLRLVVPNGDDTWEMVYDPDTSTMTMTLGGDVQVRATTGQLTLKAPVIHLDSDDIRNKGGSKAMACVGDLVAVTVTPMQAGPYPCIPITVDPLTAVPPIAAPGVGQIISGRSGVKS